jgi:hypothetical protein
MYDYAPTLGFGKFAEVPIRQVPASYLAALLEKSTSLWPQTREMIAAELARRFGLAPAPAPASPNRDPCRRCLRARDEFARLWRQAALQAHPDRGGDERCMRALNDLHAGMRLALEGADA